MCSCAGPAHALSLLDFMFALVISVLKGCVVRPNPGYLNQSRFVTLRKFMIGLGIRVFESGSGRVLSGPGPLDPSNLDSYMYL